MDSAAGDMQEEAVGMPTPRRHVETSAAVTQEGLAVAGPTPRRLAVSMAAFVADLTVDARTTGAEDITPAGDITAAEDITAQALDSVLASTRHTDMPRRSAIPRGSMINTATGSIIPVARFLTGIKWRPEWLPLIRR